jgi:hypothetical protein
MRDYVNMAGGCWTGSDRIVLNDGSEKLTKHLRKGDIVAGGHRIACIVRSAAVNGAPFQMVALPQGPTMTPWHPVRKSVGPGSGEHPSWVFPGKVCDDTDLVEVNAEFVYNLVLETGHAVRIGDWTACTLGHGFTDNDVVSHEFYGTKKVVDELRSCPDWPSGIVTLTSAPKRSGDGLVCGL